MRRTLLCGALLCPPHAFGASIGTDSAATNERLDGIVADAVDTAMRWTRGTFTVSPALAVDADTRRRMEALANGFAERQRPLYQRWARELIDAHPSSDSVSKRLSRSMGPRYLAAMADWRLRSGGAVHEALLRLAAALPATCRVATYAQTPLDDVAALVQTTPPAPARRVHGRRTATARAVG